LIRGGGLQCRVGVRPVRGRQIVECRIEKHRQNGGATDIQIGDRNRTIYFRVSVTCRV
jgi:hypothetical protein